MEDRRLSTHNASCPVWMEKAKWSISNYNRGVGVGVTAKKKAVLLWDAYLTKLLLQYSCDQLLFAID
eukprot:scaffold34473_cov72-Attheya_sp.AAC.3